MSSSFIDRLLRKNKKKSEPDLATTLAPVSNAAAPTIPVPISMTTSQSQQPQSQQMQVDPQAQATTPKSAQLRNKFFNSSPTNNRAGGGGIDYNDFEHISADQLDLGGENAAGIDYPNSLDTIKEEDAKRLSSMNALSKQSPTASSQNKPFKTDLVIDSDMIHKFHVISYKSPTNCDYCYQVLTGLIKQGVQCEYCGQNYHKKCVQNIPNVCNNRPSSGATKTRHSMLESSQLTSATATAEAAATNKMATMTNPNLIELEHSFIQRQLASRLNPVFCKHCKLKISNQKYYLYCQDCSITVHEKCADSVNKNCNASSGGDLMDTAATTPKDDQATGAEEQIKQMSIDDPSSEELSPIKDDDGEEDAANDDDDDDDEKTEKENKKKAAAAAAEAATATEDGMDTEATKLTGSRVGRYKQGPRTKRTQMSLQRVSQRVKKTNGYFWSGYMIYYTNVNTEIVTHYWKLDAKSIKIYDSYRLEKNLQTIELENIHKANLCGLTSNTKNECLKDQRCMFVIQTVNEVNYYCGLGGANTNSTMNSLASTFYNMFKMVYLPYVGRNTGNRISIKISAPKYEEKSLKEEYVINPQEMLGSGQFGQVYAGYCKANNQPVAIKVIDKTRFKEAQAETSVFQNEITILYNVHHPGIVKLMALFDETDNLYIVTEKMATDMLEMILNRQPARLTERIAKYVIYQILVALQKLHDSKIAHCDLKPENILLTENTDFPQVKICDFGYAKIIGENSFRRSMVGTPAYSPPELKQRRLYNNSIDMWSMGVIIYVSLSGTFPFEEDRDIYEQIMNSNFLFPADPWENVSKNAIDLITHFLQVKINMRASARKALNHKWFNEDSQLYQDLSDLEKRVGFRWLTSKEKLENLNIVE